MENAMLKKWTPAALAVESPLDRLPAPLYVLTGEAIDVARFCQAYWSTERDGSGQVVRPGLELAAREGNFDKSIATEIVELQEAVQAAQTQYLFAVSPLPESPMQRAEFVLGELRATLEFLFDDGKQDADDARLAKLAEVHGNPSSQDAMAAALDEYGALADLHRKEIANFGGFDTSLIDEAHTLAKGLREQSAAKVAGAPPGEQQQALDLRNRLVTLLYDRMSRVRSAAQFVFRHRPDLVRRVTSAYQRRRRADARRRQQQSAQPTPDTTTNSAQSPDAPPANAG